MSVESLAVAAALSVGVGAVLGLLGGGGGILAVPILVYVVGVAPKPAIAVSLFFVGATSAVGAALHARLGRVQFKLGATFGAASMTAAFAAGRLAGYVPEKVLLGGLAAVMLVTALAMFRTPAVEDAAARPPALGKILGIGMGVGAVSGLVGAGGGFLIVPALTLFGGLAMREAIATSLFVIALQSFAGFAGYASHVPLHWPLILAMSGASMVGMTLGFVLGKRVSARSLKHGFAGLILATGLFMLGRQLPTAWTMALLGGAIIGAAASLFLVATGRVCGISGIFAGLLRRSADVHKIRLAFVGGLVAGGWVLRLAYPQSFASAWSPPAALAVPAGVLVGFGTQLGNGCTSGHGICGVSRLSFRSIIATVTFMTAALVTVFFVRHLVGAGGP